MTFIALQIKEFKNETSFKSTFISFAIATTILHILWNELSVIKTDYWIANIIITFILSTTFYKIIFKTLLFLCGKIRCFKKLLLGKYYFEGVWIGYYNIDGTNEYYYEIFEQDLTELKIFGECFDEGKNLIGEWTIVHPNINIFDSKFTYYYEMNDSASNNVLLGYSRASIQWDKHGYPEKLVGFAVDSSSLNKQQYVSVRKTKIDSVENWRNENFWNEVKELSRSGF